MEIFLFLIIMRSNQFAINSNSLYQSANKDTHLGYLDCNYKNWEIKVTVNLTLLRF